MSNNTGTAKQKHKIETSKKLLAAVLIVCFSMIGVCIYSWMFLGDNINNYSFDGSYIHCSSLLYN